MSEVTRDGQCFAGHGRVKMSQTAAAAAAAAGSSAPTRKPSCDRSHPVRLYVERVASQDLGDYPQWDLSVRIIAFSYLPYECSDHFLLVSL